MRDEVVTVGDDSMLRVHDLISHRLIRRMVLDSPARCVAYSPDGKMLAVGLGSDTQEAGGPFEFMVVDEMELMVLHQVCSRGVWWCVVLVCAVGVWVWCVRWVGGVRE